LAGPWQLGTVPFDFNLPARFKLEYIADDGAKHQPFKWCTRALLWLGGALFFSGF